ncbi:TetR family transcriptional regulator [Arthrobacter oryzae]|uniref:TetR family transcriptional regulator n=1 Tax=Arthrobacter oryzae TaxID=409290 RepID=A0A495E751_9MICC|nr:TetR family transcriptional regulator [Arthrobacter oryzae]RKR12765.1 TetR family transcriptional regulator [Arthrobacter oryzae]
MNTGQLSENPRPGAARAAGRPSTIDPDAVARIALRLFAERGYEQTSMEDIAGAAGIGRKSLYRYFASKADLVWGGIEPVAAAAGRALDAARDRARDAAPDTARQELPGGVWEAAGNEAPPGGDDGVADAATTNAPNDAAGTSIGAIRPGLSVAQIRAGLSAAAKAGAAALPDLALTRGRLRLIAEHPELASRSYAALAPQREQGRRYLTALGVPEDMAGYLCAAYLGATFEAWMQWAAGTEPDPDPYLQAAMRVLQVPDARQTPAGKVR